MYGIYWKISYLEFITSQNKDRNGISVVLLLISHIDNISNDTVFIRPKYNHQEKVKIKYMNPNLYIWNIDICECIPLKIYNIINSDPADLKDINSISNGMRSNFIRCFAIPNLNPRKMFTIHVVPSAGHEKTFF